MIYFIRNTVTNNVKIGSSDVPLIRRNQFKTGNDCRLEMMGTIPGGKAGEDELHRRFDHLRLMAIDPKLDVGEEWFKGTPEIYEAIDRILNPLPVLFGREVKAVYLAGKITGTNWRTAIFSPGRNPRLVQRGDSYEELFNGNWCGSQCIHVPGHDRIIDYVGPFWLDISGDHKKPNPGIHAFGGATPPLDSGSEIFETNGKMVRKKCLEGVARADLLFAWIEDQDCTGTIAEITWAYSLRSQRPEKRPLIIIGCPYYDLIHEDMWFVGGMADIIRSAPTPGEVWMSIWKKASVLTPSPMDDYIYKLIQSPERTTDDLEEIGACEAALDESEFEGLAF